MSPPVGAGAGGPRAAPNLALRPQRAPSLARWRSVLRELLGRGNPAGARQLGTILVRGCLALMVACRRGYVMRWACLWVDEVVWLLQNGGASEALLAQGPVVHSAWT